MENLICSPENLVSELKISLFLFPGVDMFFSEKTIFCWNKIMIGGTFIFWGWAISLFWIPRSGKSHFVGGNFFFSWWIICFFWVATLTFLVDNLTFWYSREWTISFLLVGNHTFLGSQEWDNLTFLVENMIFVGATNSCDW